MAYRLKLARTPITAHTWSPDGNWFAYSCNTNEVFVGHYANGGFKLGYRSSHHTNRVSWLDWSLFDCILSCGYDKQVFVHRFVRETKQWRTDPVDKFDGNIFLSSVMWIPKQNSFIVTTSEDKFFVYKYNEEINRYDTVQDFYSLNKKCGKCALCIDMVPFGETCRALIAFKSEKVISFDIGLRTLTQREVGEMGIKVPGHGDHSQAGKVYILDPAKTIVDRETDSFVNSCAYSPDGTQIAYATQSSKLYVLTVDAKIEKKINLKSLPLLAVAFLTNDVIVGAGFDGEPFLFVRKDGEWNCRGSCSIPGILSEAYTPNNANVKNTPGGKGKAPTRIHSSQITSIKVARNRRFFSTASDDGTISCWPFDAIKRGYPDVQI